MKPRETSAYLRLRCKECGDCLRWYTKANSEVRKRHPLVRLPGERKPVLARRALYEAEKGPIRTGFVLAPACGDDCCIEPEHQKQISQRQKCVMGAEKGNASPTRGAKVAATRASKGLSRLTEEQVLQIRASTEQGRVWAKRLNVADKTISDVRCFKTWRNVGGNPFSALGAATA